MTYQEIKERLTKCELTLEKIKDGSYTPNDSSKLEKTTERLQVLRESLQKQLIEAKQTYLVTPKSGQTAAVSLEDDEADALKDADDIEGIKGADGTEVKEMSDDEFAQAQQAQRLEDHPEKDMIKKIQALIAKERGIKEKEGATAGEEEKFHTKLDTLVHSTFGKSKEEEEMNEAPKGVHYIKVDSSELQEALQILEAAFFNDEHIKFELNDPNVIYIKGAEESDIHDAYEELQQNGIIVDETSIGVELQEEETPEGGMDQGGDLDVAHQDDEPNMLKKDIYDIATYAAKLYKQLDKYDKHDGEVDFPHWWQKKVTLAREYISSAQHFLEAEEKQPALDQLALEESKLNEMVDPSYADMLAQFIILMGSGYGALQAVKKLGDETGDISLDSVKKAIKKHKSGDVSERGQKNEEIDETSLDKIQKAHSLVVAKMKELAQHYKTGDTSVVPQLKDLTAKKKQLERQLDDKVAGTGRDQELDSSINEEEVVAEEKATCCGKCGRVHVKGTKCKTPYLKGKDHCRTR